MHLFSLYGQCVVCFLGKKFLLRIMYILVNIILIMFFTLFLEQCSIIIINYNTILIVLYLVTVTVTDWLRNILRHVYNGLL